MYHQLDEWLRAAERNAAAVPAPASATSTKGGTSTIDLERRSVDIVWFTSVDVPRIDYLTGERYIRQFFPAGGDLSLLNNNAPLLDSHQDESCENVIGVVDEAWRENADFLATVRFSRREDVAWIWSDICDKILTKFSMGVEILEDELLPQKPGKPLVKLATEWRPFELSLVPCPADWGTTTLAGDAADDRLVRLARSKHPLEFLVASVR